MKLAKHRSHLACLAGLACIVLPGCAGMQQLRADEQALALYVNQVQSQAQAFQGQRDGLAQAREQDIRSIASDTRGLALANVQQLDAWQLARDPRYNLFTDLRSFADDSAVRRAAAIEQEVAAKKAIDDARGKIDIKVNRLGDSAKALAALAEKKGPLEELKFYSDYLREVAAKTKKLEDAAAKSADEAKTTSKAMVVQAAADAAPAPAKK